MRTTANKTTIKKGIPKSTKPATKSTPKKAPPKKVIAVASKTKTVEPTTLLLNSAPATSQSPKSKQSQLITLLKRPQGADVKELMSATGWQAHSVRGFISGTIKKKLGLNLISQKQDGAQMYRIDLHQP